MASKKVRLLTDSQLLYEANKKKLEEATKTKKRSYKHYDDDKKIDAIKTYLALGGNLSLTSRATNIKYETLKFWKTSQWWKDLVENIRKQEKLELSARAQKIVDKAMEQLGDRVVNGDFVYDQKQGELIRKPLPAKDLNTIAKDLLDRKDKLDKDTEEKDDASGNEDKLAKLAEQFAKLAEAALTRNKPPVIEVTDVVYVENNDATDEERET